MSEVEIITNGGRRRRWSADEKLRIVEETLDGTDTTRARLLEALLHETLSGAATAVMEAAE